MDMFTVKRFNLYVIRKDILFTHIGKNSSE